MIFIGLARTPSTNTAAMDEDLGGPLAVLGRGRLERRHGLEPMAAVEDLKEVLALTQVMGQLDHLET
jgi:hypothetical protein